LPAEASARRRERIIYNAGQGEANADTSARIMSLGDARPSAYSNSYDFTYGGSGADVYLTSVICRVTSQTISFGYNTPTLTSPWSTSYGTTRTLAWVKDNFTNLQTNFTHNSNAELTQVAFPYGGTFDYQYRDFTFTGNRTVREVSSRLVRPDAGAAQVTYAFARDDAGDASRSSHLWTQVDDATGGGRRKWTFEMKAFFDAHNGALRALCATSDLMAVGADDA
jgi:hypothetical protein